MNLKTPARILARTRVEPARTLQPKLKQNKMEIGIRIQQEHGSTEKLVRNSVQRRKLTLKSLQQHQRLPRMRPLSNLWTARSHGILMIRLRNGSIEQPVKELLMARRKRQRKKRSQLNQSKTGTLTKRLTHGSTKQPARRFQTHQRMVLQTRIPLELNQLLFLNQMIK